jgi:hypothetical protein
VVKSDVPSRAVAYEDATEEAAPEGYDFRDEEVPGRGSLPLRVGFLEVLEETVDSARLERVLGESVRPRSSLDELSLLPVILLHMAMGTGWCRCGKG